MSSVGQIKEFSLQTGNWSTYIERVEMYFLVNKTETDLKLPTLISLMGEEAYELLSTLASPLKPSALSYSRAVELLMGHLQPKPSVLAQRYKFRQRRQLTNETITDYVTELKKMSKNCDFNNTLDENLRDQMVCGLKSEVIRQRLFSEEKLDYNRAVSLALSLEAAERDSNAVQTTLVEGVHKMYYECSRCGDMRHQAGECQYKQYVCSCCQEIGHLRRMCPKKKGEYTGGRQVTRGGQYYTPALSRGGRVNSGNGWRGGRARGHAERGQRGATRGGPERAPIHMLDEQTQGGPSAEITYDTKECEGSGEDEPMYQMSLSQYKPVCISIKVNNCILTMEVDTGSALSCISKDVYNKFFSTEQLKPCCLNLKFYDGSTIRPLGFLESIVNYKGIIKTLDLYVIDKGTTNLIGRQWLAELNIPIKIPKANLQNNYIISEDKNVLKNLISRYKSVFDGTLGKYTGGLAELSVREGATPIYCRARSVPFALRERVDAELDAMLRAGVIEPVDRSDWATPLVVVRKPDGGLRICADFKVTLNKVLAVDRFPVPKMDDLFSNLSGNEYFTKLDLSQAYNQVVLSESSRKYTVINTHRGLFKYSRLVYGLSSSPGIFQKLMVNMFKNMPNVIVFYDDILIKNKDLESHLKCLERVLEILESNGLKIKKNKCEFLARRVKYLGFIIDRDGVRVDPDKVQAITSMSHPNNVSELKSFIGMINFYGKFIKNLSTHLSPLYSLLKKGKHWIWGTEQKLAFNKVKELLCSTNVLVHFDMECESVLVVDASSKGLGAVLSQRRGPGSVEQVVAYASRSLTSHEINYSQIHKEALAIIFAVDKFHQYLFGRKFILRTDHKPLVSIFGQNIGIPSAAASRLQRWAIKLSAYDFEIEYIKTDSNTADALSRLIKVQKTDVISEEPELPEQTYLHFSTEALLLDYNVIKSETKSDPILSRILSYVLDGWPSEIDIKELRPYFNRKNELYIELGCVMWGHRLVIPSVCRKNIISELHDAHMGIVKTKALARSYVWWPGIDEEVESACRACPVCAAVADEPPAHVPHSWPWPSRPWSRLHLDFLGPVEGLTYLIIVDSCSKWIEAIKMNRTTASAVITVLRDLWARFGLPRQTVSDNGPPFSSVEFQAFLKHNGVDHIFSAPYHPASNGAAENAVKICKRVIKKAFKQNLNVDVALCRFLLAYRNTQHTTTGDSPANILQGRNLRMRLDRLKPDRDSRVATRQAQSVQNAGGVRRHLEPGTNVWYRDYNKNSDKWLPGIIISKLGSTDYQIKSIFGTEIHRHIDQLKSRVTENSNSPNTNLSQGLYDKLSINKHSRKSLAIPLTNKETSDEKLAPVEDRVEMSVGVETASSLDGPGRSPEPERSISVPSVSQEAEVMASGGGERTKRVRRPPVRYGFEFE